MFEEGGGITQGRRRGGERTRAGKRRSEGGEGRSRGKKWQRL